MGGRIRRLGALLVLRRGGLALAQLLQFHFQVAHFLQRRFQRLRHVLARLPQLIQPQTKLVLQFLPTRDDVHLINLLLRAGRDVRRRLVDCLHALFPDFFDCLANISHNVASFSADISIYSPQNAEIPAF